jgi:hypothetical protein
LQKLKKEKHSSIYLKEQESGSNKNTDLDSLTAALQYRDRAKERRIKYGTPEPPSPKYSKNSTNSYKRKSRNNDNDNHDDNLLDTLTYKSVEGNVKEGE